MNEAVIVSGVRTPQGKFGGALSDLTAAELGSVTIKGLMRDAGIRPIISEKTKSFRPEKFKSVDKAPVEEDYHDWDEDLQGIEIDEVIMGNVLQGGQGQNPARQASIMGGIPREVPAHTVNKVCGSGMKSVTQAASVIENGESEAVIAGGIESMSNAPYVLPKARWGYRMNLDGSAEMKDMMVWDGLYEIFYDCHMGVTAENLAEAYDISREEQERLSVESQNRAVRAVEEGVFQDEIVPVEKKDEVVEKDEMPRETSLEVVKGLPPAFKKDGTVTAATSAGISDGAAAVLVTSREFAEENGLDIMASIEGFASGAVDPQHMGLGPVSASKRLFDKLDYNEEDVDLIEENEAFAAQVLACMEEMDIPRYGVDMTEKGGENVNPHGSGISLGHPIGVSGTRIMVTLLHEMRREKHDLGLSTLCIGGGMGMSTLLRR